MTLWMLYLAMRYAGWDPAYVEAMIAARKPIA
jgi:hypothetical protein